MGSIRTRMWLAPMGAAIAIVAGACGGGGSDNTGVATGDDPQIPAGSWFIDQDALRFTPSELTTKAGEKVYFKNSESALHTVDVEGENLSGTMARGDVFVWTPPGPGEYDITCEFHPQMKAKLTVE